MKIKALLATLVGALAIQGANAGTEWVPAPSGKNTCAVVDSCDKACDIGGSLTVGYDTDYVWRGVRFARDSVWADVNYTFENLPFSPNIGVWHLSSLGSGLGGSDTYGDETNIYASIGLPSILGFDTSLGYVYNLFPTTRLPQSTISRLPGLSNGGDSFSRVQFNASRELFGGIAFNYLAEYYFGADYNGTDDGELGDWFHTFGLAKSFNIFQCTSLDLSAEVGYADSFWSGLGLNNGGSGFNHYLLKAALPVALNNRATLTPYVAYNGTPDGWAADNLNPGTFGLFEGPNFNDVFFGGISLGINF